MASLFDAARDPAVRIDDFGRELRANYRRLFDEGKIQRRSPPSVKHNMTGLLLASYDPRMYTLYRYSDWKTFAGRFGIDVGGNPGERYAAILSLANFILRRAKMTGARIDDLIDVHNMVFMYGRIPELTFGTGDEDIPPPGDTPEPIPTPVQAPRESIYEYIRRHHFLFPDWLVTSYLLSLATKLFVILSGISGTGKTKLAQLMADYMAEATGDPHCGAYVAVRPDWTDNSHLLGWYNAISERYEMTPVLRTILRAAENPHQPHFVLLDEMNIARVEHYFSDFLSCMESRITDAGGGVRQAPLHLHGRGGDRHGDYGAGNGNHGGSGGAGRNGDGIGGAGGNGGGSGGGTIDGVPAGVGLPLNLYVTGTVNIDVTTYMFSPKVLDRAAVIEFNEVYLDADDLAGAAGEDGAFTLKPDVPLTRLFRGHKPATMEALAGMRSAMPDQFDHLLRIHGALEPYNMHFGYRVANEIAAFMLNAREFCIPADGMEDAAFDLQVMQKILPKLHGNAARLQGPLYALAEALPHEAVRSRAKVDRMLQRLDETGFASFIE